MGRGRLFLGIGGAAGGQTANLCPPPPVGPFKPNFWTSAILRSASWVFAASNRGNERPATNPEKNSVSHTLGQLSWENVGCTRGHHCHNCPPISPGPKFLGGTQDPPHLPGILAQTVTRGNCPPIPCRRFFIPPGWFFLSLKMGQKCVLGRFLMKMCQKSCSSTSTERRGTPCLTEMWLTPLSTHFWWCASGPNHPLQHEQNPQKKRGFWSCGATCDTAWHRCLRYLDEIISWRIRW